MKNITVLAKGIGDGKSVLKRLHEIIIWKRMKLKAIKSRHCTIVKKKVKEVNFSIAGDRILTDKKNSVKSSVIESVIKPLTKWKYGACNTACICDFSAH